MNGPKTSEVEVTIHSKPVNIEFCCPVCDEDVFISWERANPPRCWNDSWSEIECPCCGSKIQPVGWVYD